MLDQFARHYKTGETMPQALIDKMHKATTFNQGFATVEYLGAAIVDMKLHSDPTGEIDPATAEKKTLAAIGMPTEIVLRHRLPQFSHLFTSDAYSAGYYSYLWSDVMAADAWMAFEETGNPGTRRPPRSSRTSSSRPATPSIAPRPTDSSAAATQRSRHCSRTAASRPGE